MRDFEENYKTVANLRAKACWRKGIIPGSLSMVLVHDLSDARVEKRVFSCDTSGWLLVIELGGLWKCIQKNTKIYYHHCPKIRYMKKEIKYNRTIPWKFVSLSVHVYALYLHQRKYMYIRILYIIVYTHHAINYLLYYA